MLAAVSVVGIFSSCVGNKKEVSSASLELISAGTTSAEVCLKTRHLAEYAWTVGKDGEVETNPSVLFVIGNTGSLVDGDNTINIEGIEGNTNYRLAVAFKISDKSFYEEVLTLDFNTVDYPEGLSLVNTTHDGFSVYLKRPVSVNSGNVVRFGATNLAMYNLAKEYKAPDSEMLCINDEVYGTFVKGDSLITYNNDNIVRKDKNGNDVLYEGAEVILHDQIVPGEPMVFLAGEFGRGEVDGWGEGWYNALFDLDAYYDALGGGSINPWSVKAEGDIDESKFWTGYNQKINYVVKQPEPLDEQVKVEIEAAAVKGTLRITPDEGVFQYCYYVCDDATLEENLKYIDGNEEYLQWLITSAFGYTIGCVSGQGAAEIKLETVTRLEPENRYHFLITAMGDPDGITQNFQHLTFQTTEKNMAAPEVVVTAVDPEEASPYRVYFNVKCPGKNAAGGKYAANYSREFEMTLKKGKTYEDIIYQGYYFSAEDMKQINSDEGLTISYPSVPDETTRLAVMLYNDEDTSNKIKGTDDPAVADNKSDKEPAKTPVSSPLFTDLLGEWTMTADVTQYSYIDGVGGYYPAGQRSCKVTIVDKLTYPETLPEDVYDLYKNQTREYVDALYSEFKAEAEIYNAWLKGQNRLLCLGFGYADYPYVLPENGTYKDAYDLFTDKNHSAYDNRSLFWDFGPKWYLEVAADGTVSVPFNDLHMYPMLGWTLSYDIYMAAYGEAGVLFNDNRNTMYFPVSVSDGKITVNPIKDLFGGLWYPSAGFNYYGGFRSDDCVINSELTLTRGYSADVEPTAAKPAKASAGGACVKVNSTSEPAVSMYRRTPLKGLTDYQKVSYTPVTRDQLEINLQKIRKNINR